MDYYSGISEGYDELHKEEQLKKIKKVIELLKIKDNEKVLDVGCGTALYSGYFKDYIGIDKSK
ncbi:MAG: class I SAM-dependent methyltransferase, partial [Candidatus Thorarchaeota archaeon]